MKLEKLKQILNKYNINHRQWSKKRLDKLLSHINSDKTEFWEKDGQLFCHVPFVVVDVQFQRTETLWLRLVEDHTQYIGSNHVRHARPHLGVNVKIARGESSKHAARRSLKDKLGIKNPSRLEKIREYTEWVRNDTPFPGLLVRHKIFVYRYQISKRKYNPEGHQFKKTHSNKIVCFKWEPIKRDTTERRITP
ncbi:MAG: hypothetical protein AAB470_02330 [Patescibacteria group bacterium]